MWSSEQPPSSLICPRGLYMPPNNNVTMHYFVFYDFPKKYCEIWFFPLKLISYVKIIWQVDSLFSVLNFQENWNVMLGKDFSPKITYIYMNIYAYTVLYSYHSFVQLMIYAFGLTDLRFSSTISLFPSYTYTASKKSFLSFLFIK